jgi:hypothetical protein
MHTALLVAAVAILAIHGLIHLMGTTVYMKLGKIEELPYKTTLVGGRWELGESGIRVFGALWVVPAVGFVLGALALAMGWDWWRPLVVGMALVSLILTVLDWGVAYAGAITNAVILGVVLLGPSLWSRLS